MVAGIVGVGHLAALQRKTWLGRDSAGAHNIEGGAGIELWVMCGSSKARPVQFNRMR